MALKLHEVLKLRNALHEELDGETVAKKRLNGEIVKVSTKFLYAGRKNIQKITSQLEVIVEVEKPIAELVKERNEILAKYKDEDGNFIADKIKETENEVKPIIEKIDEISKIVGEMLDEEFEGELNLVDIDDMPKEISEPILLMVRD